MPKSIFIDPSLARAPSVLRFGDIPVNAYSRSFADERAAFGDTALVGIYRDMSVLREFETMLGMVRAVGEYGGTRCEYHGPAHLSLGQEAAAVGQAFCLSAEDTTFGSHRSHGEVLARGLRAVATYTEEELLRIMHDYAKGGILRAVESFNHSGDVRDMAFDFLLYGALAEIFGRSNGFQNGLGGSMHMFFKPFGIYPNNAVVGGAAPIATGAALFRKVMGGRGIAVSNIGDGALGCGVVYEAMNFAAQDQFSTLWDTQGGLPILFNFLDNGYAMGGQTRGETMAYDMPVRIGAGISPTQLSAERVDGFNPLAVIDATRRKREELLAGKGPVLLDVVTYRFGGHSASDALETYRTRDEVAAWQAQDALTTYREQLVTAGVLTDVKCSELQQGIRDRMQRIMAAAADEQVSPYVSFSAESDYIERQLFSRARAENLGGIPQVLQPLHENARVRELATKDRACVCAERVMPSCDRYNIRDALFEAIIHRMYTDATCIAYGEDVRDWGGMFGVYRGLTEALPYSRLFNAPISEAAIVSSAVGYAMSGGRAVVELMCSDFLGRAADELLNQLAKWQALGRGAFRMPVVVRVPIGVKYGAQHSQDFTAIPSHIPGLQVVYPATPYDAKGLMNSALAGTDPVIFFENQRLYDMDERFHAEGVPQDYYEIPIGQPDVKRCGEDVTIVSVGAALYNATAAADMLCEQYGIQAEIIDVRSIVPLDYTMIVQSVSKTHRVLITGEACTRGSVLQDIAQTITELCFGQLDVAPVVCGARNWVAPPADYDREYLPTADVILDYIHQRIIPLKDYTPHQEVTDAEILRRAKHGV